MPIFNTFFSFLLVLVHLQDAYSLMCIGNSSLNIMRSEFTSSNGSLKLEKLTDRVTYPSVTTSVCHVTIFIDHDLINGNIIIEFNEITNHTGNYFGIEISYPLIKENDSVVSYIDYVCSWKNLCDQIFINQWIYLLANIKHKPLQDKLIYRLSASTKLWKCDVAGKLTECSNGLCFIQYNPILDNTTLFTDCITNSSTLPSYLYVKFRSIEFKSMEYEELLYTCMSNGCDSKSTFIYVWTEIAILFDPIIESILKDLRFRHMIERASNQAIENLRKITKDQLNMYTTTRSNDSSTIIKWFSGIIVIVLIGICIHCCCSCFRNLEEYTSTPTSI